MEMALERAFFEDVAQSEDLARELARSGVTDNQAIHGEERAEPFQLLAERLDTDEAVDAFVHAVGEIVGTVVHSIMVTLDGGSQSAVLDSGPVRLIDAHGQEARPGVHEWYTDYLFETGRRS
jgi:hypothetical protein